jgi:alanine racemase
MEKNGNTIWLEINLGAIRRNIQRIHEITGKPVMAVVKANAYGHGLIEVSRAAEQAGVLALCVARIEEGLKLRANGIQAPILVMGYTNAGMVAEAIANKITLTVADPATVQEYKTAVLHTGGVLKLHAKIDTGMGRLGVLAEDGLDFCQLIVDSAGLELEGVFTHFARADESGVKTTEEQVHRFDRLLGQLTTAGIRPMLVHAGNSAGALYHPKGWYDAVRPGIAIYGLNPSPEAPLPREFEPALTWKCLLTSLKTLPAGSGVGYGHRYVTTGEESIGIAAVGYADGFRRMPGNEALLRGKRIKAVGNVCMDQSQWQVDDVPDAGIGDEVVLIGQQGDLRISADDVAARWGTINYEVVCGLTDRVYRIFLEELESNP